MADLKAKKAAEKEQVQAFALIPDSKPITWDTNIPYSKEDIKFMQDLNAQLKDNFYVIPSGKTVVPSRILWKIVQKDHNKAHWGADALYSDLTKKIVGKHLYSTLQQVTKQCEVCLRNNPQTTNKDRKSVV